jgi:hypothetical protein
MPEPPWTPNFDARWPALFAPLRAALAPFRAHATWPSLDAWNAALPSEPPIRVAGGSALHFVEQPPKPRRGGPVPRESLYDESIYTRGAVPSRPENWHDFFNMLVWVSFPASKRAINARQRAALQAWLPEGARRRPGARTREQDTLAMLDEGGLLLVCDAAIGGELEAALGDATPLDGWLARGSVVPMLLGHAIYEHVVSASSIVRALTVVLPSYAWPPANVEHARSLADAELARALEDAERFRDPRGFASLGVEPRLFEAAQPFQG